MNRKQEIQKQMANEINQLRQECAKRGNDLRKNKLDLPLFGKMSRQGHI